MTITLNYIIIDELFTVCMNILNIFGAIHMFEVISSVDNICFSFIPISPLKEGNRNVEDKVFI